MSRLLVVLAVVAVLTACDAFGGFDELTLARQPYPGNALRVDGYYAASGPTGDGERFVALFLFRNGVVRYGGSSVGRDVLESKFGQYGDRRYDWGVFVVEEDQIKIERWYPGDGPHVPAIVKPGRIVDDTTFGFTSALGTSEVYSFRRFAPKPDSTSLYLP